MSDKARAMRVAQEIKARKAGHEEISAIVTEHANDPDELHFTPLLITALRLTLDWPKAYVA